MCKKDQYSLKMSSPQFSLWVFAFASQVPCSGLPSGSLFLQLALSCWKWKMEPKFTGIVSSSYRQMLSRGSLFG